MKKDGSELKAQLNHNLKSSGFTDMPRSEDLSVQFCDKNQKRPLIGLFDLRLANQLKYTFSDPL